MGYYIDFGTHKDIALIDWPTNLIFGQYVLDTYLLIKMTKQKLNDMSNDHYILPYMALNNISVDNLTHRLLVVIYSGTISRLIIYFGRYRCYHTDEELNFQEFRFIVEYVNFCMKPVWKSLDTYLKNKIMYQGYKHFTDVLHIPKFIYTKGEKYERLCKLGETINQKIKEIDHAYNNYGLHSSIMCIDEWIR